MQNRDFDALDILWLFAPQDSDQVEDPQWDSSISIVFTNALKGVDPVIFGSASVVDDACRKRQLWSPEAPNWFPGGADDTALALVRVCVIQVDCLDVQLSRVARQPG
jgi:general stress protein 26